MRAVVLLVMFTVLSALAACDDDPAALDPTAISPHAAAALATFTVNVADDVDDGACDSSHCSLREAITAANGSAGLDDIHFAIAGDPPYVIEPSQPLPDIVDPVVIDGTTQPGFAAGPIVELDGSSAGQFAPALSLRQGSSGSTVRGLVIRGFGRAIVVALSNDNRIEGNYLGTDVTGEVADGNLIGVDIAVSTGNIVGGTSLATGNLISGNETGVLLQQGTTDDNAILGNLIGTDVTGTKALGNEGVGVWLNLGSDNIVGGTTPAARNVIAGNGSHGIHIRGSSISSFPTTGNLVQGNYIGVDITGLTGLGNGGSGVLIWDADENVVGGVEEGARNVIADNTEHGVQVEVTDVRIGPTPPRPDCSFASGNIVQGNFIGVDATGEQPLGNGRSGIFNQSTATTIGGAAAGAGNIISASGEFGIALDACFGATIQGNFIGTDVHGTADLGNADDGINGAKSNDHIGGSEVGAGNVIAGNGGDGIQGSAVIQGNFIGTTADGTAALGNDGFGIKGGGMVGGAAPGAGNVISGNALDGLDLSGMSVVQGNLIGVDASGTSGLGNGGWGIIVSTSDNLIGGTEDGAGNVIGANGKDGIAFGRWDNQVEGNWIGTDRNGSVDLGNAGHGITFLNSGADRVSIGGATPGAGNVIAFNEGSGVNVFGRVLSHNCCWVSNVGILSNSIFGNGGLGIDLTEHPTTGVTPNDAGDVDLGANLMQNFPVLTSATTSSTTTVEGLLHSTGNATFRVELFANAACDLSGHGEGERLVAVADLTTGADGNADLAVTLQEDVPLGHFITATATDPDDNTSEFSACVEVLGLNSPPVAAAGGPYTGDEGSPVAFDGSGSTDPDEDPLEFEWEFGDGDGETGSATPSHTYLDDGDYTATLSVRDPQGLEASATATVTIANVAPQVDAGPDATVLSGTPFQFEGTFSDPGILDAPWTWEIDWGDGSPNGGGTSSTAGSIAGSHSYLEPGDYAITVTVTDKDGASHSDGLTLTVKPIPVAIDIKPGSFPNSINTRSNGVIPVAVLTGSQPSGVAHVDATTIVDATVLFAGAAIAHRAGHAEDVDADLDTDAVYHFRTRSTDIERGDTTATLTARLADGRVIVGTDSVRFVR